MFFFFNNLAFHSQRFIQITVSEIRHSETYAMLLAGQVQGQTYIVESV